MQSSRKPWFSSLNTTFAKLAAWSYRNRWLVGAVSLLILVGCSYLAQQVRTDNSFEAFFDESDPAYLAYQVHQENFGSDEIIYLMYDASGYEHGVFNRELVNKIQDLTAEIDSKVPFVRRVMSVTNAELMMVDGDDLIISSLDEEMPLSQKRLLELSNSLKKRKLYEGNLYSKDLAWGGILVEMSRTSTDPLEKIQFDPEKGSAMDNLYPMVSNAVLEDILQNPKYADIPFSVSGDVPLNAAYNEILVDELGSLGVVCLLIIAVILGVFFRGNLIAVIAPIGVVILSFVMTVAFIEAMGWHLDMGFGIAPVLLMAVGIAHAVHITSEFLILARRYEDREKALYETLYLVGTPCLLTSITTMVGFASMSLTPIRTVAHAGIYMSFGVLSAFFLSVVLLTFFLSFMKSPATRRPAKPAPVTLNNLLSGCAQFTLNNSKKLMSLFLVVLAVSFWGISKLRVDSNWLMDFTDRVPVKVDAVKIDNTMTGLNPLAFLLDTKKEGGIKNPEFLKELERLQAEVETHFPLVRKSTSIVDLVKELNQSMNNDDPAYYRIPDSRELISQYLLVYEISGGEDLRSFVSEDYSKALLQIRAQLVYASELQSFEQQMNEYLAAHRLTESEKSTSGMGALLITLLTYINFSQIEGLTIAVIAITLVISVIYGSLKMGLVSMIPNLGPIIVVAGLMGLYGVVLDTTKLFIATIALGIAVDDTIHLVTRFRLEFQKIGNYRQAYVNAVQEVGRALIITTLSLVLGLCVLLLSLMSAQVWFGLLLALAMVLALVFDIFIMPILIIGLKPFGPELAAALPAVSSYDSAQMKGDEL
ncbi:MMPL family transporter [Ketobacter sp. MCCC 1A13808]|uniref:efflux RND transporter permease subunit n=1 Tax=Ketobacter sp. MCCC 1A13808 TaxID=2602738 RepID=UPI0012EB82AC|nr:MMPL family transporter [Ketobacter sp. MCCC 1A13808]MVF14477.1 MMPL family transporter [Ketobacter sp. MCCC 1A13808]